MSEPDLTVQIANLFTRLKMERQKMESPKPWFNFTLTVKELPDGEYLEELAKRISEQVRDRTVQFTVYVNP
jgi:hypothetical protein